MVMTVHNYHVGQIIYAFRNLSIGNKICFIISADHGHGESFGK